MAVDPPEPPAVIAAAMTAATTVAVPVMTAAVIAVRWLRSAPWFSPSLAGGLSASGTAFLQRAVSQEWLINLPADLIDHISVLIVDTLGRPSWCQGM
jgi:hypothetical protein